MKYELKICIYCSCVRKRLERWELGSREPTKQCFNSLDQRGW